MVQVGLANYWLVQWCEWVWLVGLVVQMGLVVERFGFADAKGFCLYW